MRRLLFVTLISMLLGMVLLLSAIFSTRNLPSPTRIENFRLEACALPCWLGIEVGKTSIADAKRILKTNFPKPKYSIELEGAGIIRITDRLTTEPLTVLFNDPGDPATQRNAARVMALELWLGAEHPLTASELFGLVGQPETIGIVRQSVRFQAYAMYCTLRLRATSLMTGFEVSSPDSDMGRLIAVSPTQDACESDDGFAWEGYTTNYRKQLMEATNRYLYGN
jgi:hypothetical protein